MTKIQCYHLTEEQHNKLLKLLQIFEELFDGRLGTWKTNPVDFRLERGCEADMLITISSTKGTAV